MDFDGTLLGPLISYHFDRKAGFNERHPGLGYSTADGYGAGWYRNSLDKDSFYVGKEWRKPLNGMLDATLQASLVTGYPAAPVLPAVMPGLLGKLGDGHELALMLMPPAGKYSRGGVALQYRKKLK